jgi:hypothetical protein
MKTGGFVACRCGACDAPSVVEQSADTERLMPMPASDYRLVKRRYGKTSAHSDRKRKPAGAWSPDGKQIAFGRADHMDDYRIVVTDVVRAEERVLPPIIGGAYAWSPDGNSIAHDRKRGPGAGPTTA